MNESRHVSFFGFSSFFSVLAGEHRRVEVKLKCKEVSPASVPPPASTSGAAGGARPTPNAVSLYLLEPQPCEYVLGVEAAFLCPLIDAADADALIPLETLRDAADHLPPAPPTPPSDGP